MLAEKIDNVNKALSSLAHKVGQEIWAVLKLVKNELTDCYDLAKELETTFIKEDKDDSGNNTKESKGI
ncbi:hypothetical protein [Desulfovulcanus sp.]